MICRVIGCLLLVLYSADSVVEFPTSRIYDEFDFKGQSTVTIDKLCAGSCRIFASITLDSRKFANNLLVQLSKGFSSVSSIADNINSATNQKNFLEIKNMPTVTIVNANANLAAGPLVIYVVDGTKNASEVYEADMLNRAVYTMPKTLTVMSATPFTLKQAALPAWLPQGLLATMTGYDQVNGTSCPNLYHSTYTSAFPAFTMEVNGPIVTLMWAYTEFDYAPGGLTGTLGITNKRKLERSGWVGSPGYHGCPGIQMYRSSLYDFSSPFHAEITSYDPAHVSVGVITDSDAAHAVSITDPGTGAQYSVSNTSEEAPVTFDFPKTMNITIDWMPDGANGHFLARWKVTDAP